MPGGLGGPQAALDCVRHCDAQSVRPTEACRKWVGGISAVRAVQMQAGDRRRLLAGCCCAAGQGELCCRSVLEGGSRTGTRPRVPLLDARLAGATAPCASGTCPRGRSGARSGARHTLRAHLRLRTLSGLLAASSSRGSSLQPWAGHMATAGQPRRRQRTAGGHMLPGPIGRRQAGCWMPGSSILRFLQRASGVQGGSSIERRSRQRAERSGAPL